MQGIDLTQTTFIWAITRANILRLDDEPPAYEVPLGTNGALQADLEKSNRYRASHYDWYRDIEVISLLQGAACVHLVRPRVLDGWKTTPNRAYTEVATSMPRVTLLYGLPSEVDLLAQFWCLAGDTCGTQTLGGWQIDASLVPMLVNKAMLSDIKVPDRFRTDPMRRYGGADNILAVDAIYTQHSRSPLRPVPELSDVLSWWSVPFHTALPFPTREELLGLTYDQWVTVGCRAVEKYLVGMQYITARYYGYIGQYDALPNLWRKIGALPDTAGT
jgi:hypothetical protein